MSAIKPILVSVSGGCYDEYSKRKRNNPMCDPWDSQGNEKNAISISTAFSVDILIRKKNIYFRGLVRDNPEC